MDQKWVSIVERKPKKFGEQDPMNVSVPLLFQTHKEGTIYLRMGYYDHNKDTFFESGYDDRGWRDSVTHFYEFPLPPAPDNATKH